MHKETTKLNPFQDPIIDAIETSNQKYNSRMSSKLINSLRRDQVNLLVYRPDRPYFKQKQKSNIAEIWPTGFF